MDRKYIPALIFFTYALLLGNTIIHHEMWRDEVQTWGIVTHSNSFSDLIENKKYEGHPILWFAIIWVVSKITVAPESMQVINYIFSLITAGIIVFKSPFSIFQKALIIFGYYFFYEYAAISRNYMIAMMMIISICALWKKQDKHVGPLMVLLFLLCFTEVYALLLSLTLAFTLFLQQFFRSHHKYKWRSFLFPVAALTGFLVSYLTTVPPEDSEFNYPIRFAYNKDHLIRVLGNFWNGFIPVPKFQESFWSTSLWYESVTAAVLGIILMVIILYQAFPYRILFVFLLTSFLGILLFMYFKYAGFPRHFGHLFIIYICYEWLKRYETGVVVQSAFQRLTTVSLFYLLLLINVCAGISFAVADWILPFSAGKQMAEYIEDHFPEQVTVAGYTDCPATTVANYLQRDIYLLNNLRKTNFILFAWSRAQPDGDVILNNIFMLTDSLKSLALVMNYELEINGDYLLPDEAEEKTLTYHSPTGDHHIHFRNLIYLGNSMVEGESYFLYDVRELD